MLKSGDVLTVSFTAPSSILFWVTRCPHRPLASLSLPVAGSGTGHVRAESSPNMCRTSPTTLNIIYRRNQVSLCVVKFEGPQFKNENVCYVKVSTKRTANEMPQMYTNVNLAHLIHASVHLTCMHTYLQHPTTMSCNPYTSWCIAWVLLEGTQPFWKPTSEIMSRLFRYVQI